MPVYTGDEGALIVDPAGDILFTTSRDIAPDGRFLVNTELPGDAAPITLIQN